MVRAPLQLTQLSTAQRMAGCHLPSLRCCSASNSSTAESRPEQLREPWGGLGLLCSLGPLCHRPAI